MAAKNGEGAKRFEPMFAAVRVLAALGIVWNHTMRESTSGMQRWDALGMFGVPLFTIASIYFCLESGRRRRKPLTCFLHERSRRILVPFALWSLLYFLLKCLAAHWMNVPPPSLQWSMLLWGGHSHLWFLPFVFVMCALAYAAAERVWNRPQWLLPCGLVACGGAAILAGLPDAVQYLPPELQSWQLSKWWHALPAAFLGLALTLFSWSSAGSLLRQPWLSGLALLLWAASTGAVTWLHGQPLLEIVSGLALMVAGLATWSPRWVQTVAAYGRYGYGVYLVHKTFTLTLPLLSRQLKISGWAWDVASFTVAVAGSFALNILWSRWVVRQRPLFQVVRAHCMGTFRTRLRNPKRIGNRNIELLHSD